MQMSGMSRLSVVFAPACATRTTSFSTCSAFTAIAFESIPKANPSGAWIGEPTDQRLMLVRRIS